MDTIPITLTNGKWIIGDVSVAEGDDVFIVNSGEDTKTYTFSEGEYGKRILMLNIENNDDYILGVYHISGTDAEGATGYYLNPGGEPSVKDKSKKRLPPDVYDLAPSPQSALWVQPWIVKGAKVGDVSSRGVKIHYGTSVVWTEGCFVISTDYYIYKSSIKFNLNISISTLEKFDKLLGAKRVAWHTYINPITKKIKKRLGAEFGEDLKQYKLILKDGL